MCRMSYGTVRPPPVPHITEELIAKVKLLWIHITYTMIKLNNRSFSFVHIIRTSLQLGLVGVI